MNRKKRKEYNQRYYNLNKDKINKDKRERYALDRKYADNCKKRSQSAYNRKSGVEGKADRTVVVQNGVVYYTVGFFRVCTGREPSTIRTLHRKGIIPEVTVVNSNGWRLYSEKQKDLIIDMFQALDDGEIRFLREYTSTLQDGWDE